MENSDHSVTCGDENEPIINHYKPSEYETEFFEFSPKAFIDTIYNVITEVLHETFSCLHLSVAKTFTQLKNAEQGDLAVKTLMKRLERHCCHRISKFQEWCVDKIFHVPKHVVLNSDKIQLDQRYQMSPSCLEELLREIAEKEARLKALLLVNHKLQSELVEANGAKLHCKSFIKQSTLILNESEVSDNVEDSDRLRDLKTKIAACSLRSRTIL